MSAEELKLIVEMHHRLLMGDPENPKDMPGIIAEQRRTNEILGEVKDALSRINWLIIGGFIVALGSLVIKGFTGP